MCRPFLGKRAKVISISRDRDAPPPRRNDGSSPANPTENIAGLCFHPRSLLTSRMPALLAQSRPSMRVTRARHHPSDHLITHQPHFAISHSIKHWIIQSRRNWFLDSLIANQNQTSGPRFIPAGQFLTIKYSWRNEMLADHFCFWLIRQTQWNSDGKGAVGRTKKKEEEVRN